MFKNNQIEEYMNFNDMLRFKIVSNCNAVCVKLAIFIYRVCRKCQLIRKHFLIGVTYWSWKVCVQSCITHGSLGLHTDYVNKNYTIAF